MGASGWTYWTRWEGSPQASLDALRARVFRSGEFHCHITEARETLRDPLELQRLRSVLADGPPEQSAAWFAQTRAFAATPLPRTIDELVDLQADSGTHSILDIARARAQPRSMKALVAEKERFMDALRSGRAAPGTNPYDASFFTTACPLPEAELTELFGTARPARARIEERGIPEGFQRWEAVWVAAYDGGEPVEVVFSGWSGD